MNEVLRNIFNERGIFDAAPNFMNDFKLYSDKGLWNKINCISYAIGYRKEGFSFHNRRMTNALYHREEIPAGIAHLLAHTSVLPITDNNLENTPEGYYPIAGFLPYAVMGYDLDGNFQDDAFIDYHWYRMDDDGTWSHKDGWHGTAMQIDSKKNLITNPMDADRYSFRDGHNYSRFMGFFSVPKGGTEIFTSKRDIYRGIEQHVRETLVQQVIPRMMG